MQKCCHQSDLQHIRGLQIAYNDFPESIIYQIEWIKMNKMMPCHAIGILKMISYSTARPHAAKKMYAL